MREMGKTWLFLIAVGLFCCRFVGAQLCQTPKNVSGECKLIKECPALFAIVLHRPIKSSDADYLKRSQCGFEDISPKVCCPIENESNRTTTEEPTTNALQRAGPLNVSMLPTPDDCTSNVDDKIIGGEKAGLSEFPWMVLLEYKTENNGRIFFCGGVLISKRYILTAAHCIKGKNLPNSWKLVSVRLGEYDTDTPEDCVNHGFRNECAPPPLNIPVEESIAHSQYDAFDMNQYHDIAILRLEREVSYTTYVKPICLPVTDEHRSRDFTGKKLTIAGWGKTQNTTDSSIKLKLNVPVKDNIQCRRTYRAANINLGSGQLCAGGETGKDTCRGDSGGPLMTVFADENGDFGWYSIGVVSFGPSPCGMKNWPGVYTKVAEYVPWIISKMRP